MTAEAVLATENTLSLSARGNGWTISTRPDGERFVTRVKRENVTRAWVVVATVWHDTAEDATEYHNERTKWEGKGYERQKV